MIIIELRPGLWSLSHCEKDLRIFMGDSYTDSGLIYNSFVCLDQSECVVFGVPNTASIDRWSEKIAELCGNRNLSYVSCGQSADLLAVTSLRIYYPTLRIVGSAAAMYSMGENGLCIRGRRKLSLAGKTWELSDGAGGNISAFCKEINVLISGRAYGSYCATEKKEDWLRGAQNYRRDNPFAWDVARGTELICPVIGPVVENVRELEGLYADKYHVSIDALILTDGNVFSAQLADNISQGVSDSGIKKIECISLAEVSRDEVLALTKNASALLFGYSGTAHKAILDILTSQKAFGCKGKPVLTFFCAENSECKNELRIMMEPMGFELSASDFACVGKPDEESLKAAYEKGFDFGCALQHIENPRAPKLVKCLVCGEIFDAALGICPVCGVGLEQCIPVEEDAVAFSNDTDNDYLIIGGGIAAVSAAEAIRKRDKTGAINIISAEETLPINRPMLTKDMQTAIYRPEEMLVYPESWYAERDIRFRLSKKVTDIDTENKTVTLQNGEKVGYSKLIYALGGECFLPPIKGIQKRGVFTIRRLADVHNIASTTLHAKRAVVIGGGVLGLEAASELHRIGLEVVVLESAAQICARQIDKKSSSSFVDVMEGVGVPCIQNVCIDEIYGNDTAEGVRLDDGREFAADIVVVSCGIKSNYELAQASGIITDRGVIVNNRMETSASDVYSCGDCAVYDGINYQLWAEATEQGKVAGANAAGDKLGFSNKPLGFSLAGFGTSIYAIGDIGKKNKTYRTVETVDSVLNKAETYFFVGGRLEGAIVFNKNEKIDSVTSAVLNHARYNELF